MDADDLREKAQRGEKITDKDVKELKKSAYKKAAVGSIFGFILGFIPNLFRRFFRK